MNNKIILYFLLIFFTSYFAIALPYDNLIGYISFDDISLVNDTKELVHDDYMTYTGDTMSIVSSNCKIDTCLFQNSTLSNQGYLNYTFDNNTFNGDFSINFWYFNPVGWTNSQNGFFISNSTTQTTSWQYRLGFGTNSTFFRNGYGIKVSVSNTAQYLNDSLMITLTYDDTNRTRLYINSELVAENLTFNLADNIKYFVIGNLYNNYVDEYSIWNTELNQYDIDTLYNAGAGLSKDDVLLWNGSNIGDNESTHYYDICIPSIISESLCHDLIVNQTSVFCSVTNTEICSISCTDNFNYYYSINQSPVGNNYSGKCDICINSCDFEGQLSCQGDYNVICKEQSNHCFQYTIQSLCDGECEGGVCIITGTNTTAIPPGVTSRNDTNLWENFLNIDANSDRNRLLIAVLVIIICGCLGAGLIFGISNASGGRLPAFMVIGIESICIIIPILYFIMIGFIPFWILVITIILIAFILAGTITNRVFPR